LNLSEFENNWYTKVKNEILRSFPDDFIIGSNHTFIDLPGKPLLKGTELFGNYEIIDIDGDPLLSTDSIDKIKYILYSNRELPQQIRIPQDENELTQIVREYENHLDEIIKLIRKDFTANFPESKKLTEILNKIFQLLNLQRH
jgi:hypothetical protein